MDYERLMENFFIYTQNLSSYYLISIFLSFLSVVFAWWFRKYNIQQAGRTVTSDYQGTEPKDKNEKEPSSRLIEVTEPGLGKPGLSRPDVSKYSLNSDGVLNQFKVPNKVQNVPVIISELTEDQKEKEVITAQLQNIYSLMQDCQDKFNISSVEELEDQMKLYKL